ncbi:unknown [Firmicutes bacterium CAG:534]|nr:unknown [Firmicutes bacterium CAG:534]
MDYEMNGIPLGLSMALLMNEQAKAGYDALSETQKEHLILKCKDAGSKEEMDRIISSIYPAESVESLFEEPDID